MNPTPNRRRRPATTALVLAGALAACPAPARAGDDGVTRTHVQGWPRCSETPPSAIDQPPDSYGDANDADGTEFSTNWFLDADPGDDDVVWFRVDKASIQGYGCAVDADPDSGTSRRGTAWGEDRLTFRVATTADQTGTIVVTNRIRVAAAWVVEGTGVNHVVLRGEALDVNGTVHTFERIRAVDPKLAATMTEGSTSTSQSSDRTTSTDGDGGSGDTTTSSDRETSTESDSIERRVESATTDTGQTEARWEYEKRFAATECSVRIASSELVEVKAQAMVDDVETTSEVTYFDTVNVVEGKYVVDGGPGAGTPGGEDPSSPGTPGGEDGSSPGSTTPSDGGTAPAPEPEPSAPLPSDPGLPPPDGGTDLGGGDGGTEPGIDESGSEPAPDDDAAPPAEFDEPWVPILI
jgi:hypothetical protein